MSFGSKIKELRRQQHITQERLADVSDMTVNYLSKIERGVVTNVSADKLAKIAKTLNVTMDELFNDEEASKQNQRPHQHVLELMLNQLPADEAEKYSEFFIHTLDTFQNK